MNNAAPADRRSWSYFSTPLRYFLWVFVPICALMAPLAVVAQRWPLRASAALVLLCSAYAAIRGYFCRVEADRDGVRYRSLSKDIRIRWPDIRRLDRYAPGAGNAAYIYLTCEDRPPLGRWEIDDRTIQLQDRPGLLEALREARDAASPNPSNLLGNRGLPIPNRHPGGSV